MKTTLLAILSIIFLLGLVSVEDCPCNRVHHPSRLVLLDSSKMLVGKVDKIESDIDGDTMFKDNTIYNFTFSII